MPPGGLSTEQRRKRELRRLHRRPLPSVPAGVARTELSACCPKLHAACLSWSRAIDDFRPVFIDPAGEPAKLWPTGQGLGL